MHDEIRSEQELINGNSGSKSSNTYVRGLVLIIALIIATRVASLSQSSSFSLLTF